jgi:hypothetical protein
MFKFLKKLFNVETVEMSSKTKYDGSRWDLTNRGCPDCGEKKFYSGPEGGMCVNICCSNPLCRSAFNVMGIANMVERIPNTHFRSVFSECPEESNTYLAVEIANGLNKETNKFIDNLVAQGE